MSQNRAPDKHFRLSPSGSSRWLKCPFSAVDDLPQEQNPHTLRGNRLHSIAAHYLEDGLPIFGYGTDADHVRLAVKAASALTGEREIEIQLVSSEIDEFGGTVDVLTYDDADPDGPTLTVFDFKFGSWKVPAAGNTQLMCYLVLAWERYPDAKKFRGIISQPKKRKTPDIAEFTAEQLRLHKRAVQLAGTSDDKRGGEWCRFCPLLANCAEGQQYYPAE